MAQGTLTGEPLAIVTNKPGRYYAIVFFVHGEEERDLLGSIWRDGEGPWHLTYRTRYYDPASRDPHDGLDKKRFFDSTLSGPAGPDDEAALCRSVTDAMRAFMQATGFNDKMDVVELHTDNGDAVIEKMLAQPWSHMKFGGEA